MFYYDMFNKLYFYLKYINEPSKANKIHVKNIFKKMQISVLKQLFKIEIFTMKITINIRCYFKN